MSSSSVGFIQRFGWSAFQYGVSGYLGLRVTAKIVHLVAQKYPILKRHTMSLSILGSVCAIVATRLNFPATIAVIGIAYAVATISKDYQHYLEKLALKLNPELRDLSEKVTKLQTEHQTLSREVSQLKKDKAQVSKEYNAIVHNLPLRKAELSQIEGRLPGVKQELDDLQGQILDLTPKAKTLNEEIAKLQLELNENAEKVAQLREFDTTIQSLQRRKENLTYDVLSLEGRIKEAKKKISKPTNQSSLFYCTQCVQAAVRNLGKENPKTTVTQSLLQNMSALCQWPQHPGTSNQVYSGYYVTTTQ